MKLIKLLTTVLLTTACIPSESFSIERIEGNDILSINPTDVFANGDKDVVDAFIKGVINGSIKPNNVVPQIDPSIQVDHNGTSLEILPMDCTVISDGKSYPCPIRSKIKHPIYKQ